MDQLTQEIFGQVSVVSPIAAGEMFVALLSSAVLTLIIAKLYCFTHGGYSYSKTFLQTIVLVGVTVSLIMVVIGSDIARAFALVGAMSIVRFRTPIKDSRDLVFIFAAIAIGMACGVQFHQFAVIFTAFVAVLLLAFHYWKFGELPGDGYVLRMRLRSADREGASDLCAELCRRCTIVSVSRSSQGDELEDVIYEVELKRGVTYTDLVNRLTGAIEPLSISVLVGEGYVNA